MSIDGNTFICGQTREKCLFTSRKILNNLFEDNIVQNYISVCFTITVQLHYGMKGICL